MSSQRGKLITCDRCGESVFVKELDVKEKETDGGFIRWNEYKYEDIPEEGWADVYFGVEYTASIYTLCSTCMHLFDFTKTRFFTLECCEE